MEIINVPSPNHYNGRQGRKVTHITLHIMSGYLSGTDAMFSRKGQASASYGVGANGQIHRYVSEADGPWSDANKESNLSTISIEHEGGIPQAKCTRECMDASAWLCADISRRYGLGRLWHDGTRGNVWLHREIPGSDHATCPDLAPNGLDVNYVISKANQLLGATQSSDAKPAPSTPQIAVDGVAGPATIKRWQQVLGTPVDGVVSGQLNVNYRPALTAVQYGNGGSTLIRKVQSILGTTQDGLFGPNTIKALQRHLGVNADGIFGSQTVKALQNRLNTGKF